MFKLETCVQTGHIDPALAAYNPLSLFFSTVHELPPAFLKKWKWYL